MPILMNSFQHSAIAAKHKVSGYVGRNVKVLIYLSRRVLNFKSVGFNVIPGRLDGAGAQQFSFYFRHDNFCSASLIGFNQYRTQS